MKNIQLIILFFIVISCRERILNYDLPFEGEKLVVYSYLRAGNPIEVNLSHTWRPIGMKPTTVYVEKAIVKIFFNGKYQETLADKNLGKYASSTRVVAGGSYKIEIVTQKYGTTFSKEVKIPKTPPKIDISIRPNLKPIINNDTPQDAIEIVLNQDEDPSSHYGFLFQTIYPNNVFRTAIFPLTEDAQNRLEQNDCEIGGETVLETNYAMSEFHSNDCFIDKKIKIAKSIEKVYDVFINNKLVGVKSVLIQIRVLKTDENYHKYMKNLFTPSGTELLLIEPSTTYTNISNGYGIVTGINEVTYKYIPELN